MIRLLSMLLLIGVFVVVASAQQPLPPDKSESRSPVKTSALALVAELETPSTCSPDDTLCLSEITLAKLKSAIAGLKSIARIADEREAIIDDQKTRIEIRGGIIEDLKRVDTNNQKIDANQQQNAMLYQGIIANDKLTIGNLQHKLDSCQGNQKWIALVSAGGGAYLGYRFGQQQNNLNPFASFAAPQGYPSVFYRETSAEKIMREALKQK